MTSLIRTLEPRTIVLGLLLTCAAPVAAVAAGPTEEREQHSLGAANAPSRSRVLPAAIKLPGGGVRIPRELKMVATMEEADVRDEDGGPDHVVDLSGLPRSPFSVGANVRVNDTSGDPVGNSVTNSETAIAILGTNIVAAWNDGKGFNVSPGGTGYANSTNGGSTFTDGGVPPVTGPLARHQGDPAIAVDDSGNYYLADLYTPDGSTSAVAVTRGAFSGAVFSFGTPVIVASSATDYLDKEWLTVDPATGIVYVAWTRFGGGGSQIEFTRSTTGGVSWDPIQVLTETAIERVQAARIVVGRDHEVQVVYLVFDRATSNNYMRARRSTTLGVTFDPEVTLPTGPSGILSNYGAGPPGFNRARGMGFPSLAIDRSDGPNRGRVYVTWEETVNVYSDILGALGTIAETENNGSSAAANPVAIGQTVEGSLSSATDEDWYTFSGSAGQTVIVYLTPGTGDGNLRLFAGGGVIQNRAMFSYIGFGTGLVVYTLPYSGTYWFRVLVNTSTLGTYTVYTAFDTPAPGDEVARDTRDVILQCSMDGTSWEPRRVVNDDPAVFDDAFPEVAVNEQGDVYVDWYDHRGDPLGIGTDVYYSRSVDGGASFPPGVRINDGPSINWNVVGSNLAPNLGDYNALMADGCAVYANFADGRQGTSDSWIARISDPRPTSTSLNSAPNPGACAQPVTFTARVDPSTATGVVSFFDGGTPIGSAPLENGVATLTIATLSAGEHSITAVYSGDGCRAANSSAPLVQVQECPTAVTPASVDAFALRSIRPNPSRASVRIDYSVARESRVRLDVVDLQGREVVTLVDGVRAAGRHEAVWDGRAGGAPAPVGMYFVRYRVPGKVLTGRLVLAR
jgi:hypothetical protein